MSNSTKIAGWMLAGALALPVWAQEAPTGPIVIPADHYDTSLPVRDLTSMATQASAHRVAPLIRRPGPPITGSGPDPVVQQVDESAGPLVVTTNLLNFDGIHDRDGLVPPDTNASVGATQVVETVNVSYQVFDKATGGSVFGPAEMSSIFAGFGGVCQSGPDFSDPVVLYDKLAGRWLITIIASNNGFNTGNECVAVSTTSDATGSYHRYVFSFGSDLNDYPKFGVWPDAYYASYNLFGADSGSEACAYDRATMLTGGLANAICFKKPNDFSLMPSDLDGAGLFTSGEPDFFLELATSTTLNLFKFHVDFAVPANSTFTGPTAITVASYTEACGGGSCIPQLGTGNRLDSLADRLMFRLAYRAFPADHEALLVTHSVKPTGTPVSGIRWYEIRSPNTAPSVFQQGTLSTNNTLWMGSAAMDKHGDIAAGYSASSAAIHPSISYTGRVPTDPLGTLEGPFRVITGTGSQTGANRWGDYSSMSIDPSDDCTFWYTQEYLTATGDFNWHTRLNSFKFNSCH